MDPEALLRDQVRALTAYTPGEQRNRAVKLNTNESAWPPSPAVLRTLREFDPERLRQYPAPAADALREVAAEVFDLDPAAVLVGNGSDDCLTILFRSVLAPGDPVACPWPTYGLYATCTAIQGGELVTVPYEDLDGDWRLPEALDEVPARLVLVANPNNPSGSLVPCERLCRLVERSRGLVVIDEAYVDFAPPGSSMLPHVGRYPNLVVLRSFSKSYALAGARLGLLFAAPRLVAQLLKVKDSYNVNALTQAIGCAALRDRAHHADLVARTLAQRDALAALAAGRGWTWPASGANFLLCRVGPTAGRIYRQLKEREVLIRHWDTPELRECLRISVGDPSEQAALAAALDGGTP